jgi:hypothetical protein
MTLTYLSGPAIARLRVCSRMVANEDMRAGRYGPLLRWGQIGYAALDAVERHIGHRISAEQLAAAVDGHPDRVLTIIAETEEAA